MSLRLPLAQSCRACLRSSRQVQQRLPVLLQRPCSATPRRADAETASSANLASTGPAPAPQPSRVIPLPPPSPPPSSEATAHSKLVEARELAKRQLRHLLSTLDSSARKQAQAFSAALRALELERKLREAGGAWDGYDIVHVRDVLDREFATRLSNVFVIGAGAKAFVSLPKGKGVKLSIAEESDQRRHRLEKQRA